jgi:Flp pilus assembly protein TadG
MGRILSKTLGSFRRDTRATAAIEFGAAGMVLAVSLLNAVDVGFYMYRRMEVENAAEVGAQAAWKTCNTQAMLPATNNCPTLNSTIATAIQSTSLGNKVSLASGYPAEGYYCVNASNALQSVGSLSSRPSDCSAVGSASTTPGDYLQVQVTFKYTPLFPGISVMSGLGISSIASTSWMRLG